MVSLYRHFGAGNKLLYVGISHNALHRLYNHMADSEWYPEIVRVDIEHYPSLQSALNAEKQAIKNEGPIYNKTHNPNSSKPVKQVITESEVSQHRLVVAERSDISKFYKKRWSIEWIADHFGTSVDIIKFVLKKDAFIFSGGKQRG